MHRCINAVGDEGPKVAERGRGLTDQSGTQSANVSELLREETPQSVSKPCLTSGEHVWEETFPNLWIN